MLFGCGVHEVGLQLVEHDDHRPTSEKIHPCRLSRRGQRRVVVRELLLLPELFRNGTPDAERGIALAARECDDSYRFEIRTGFVKPAHDL